MNKPNDRPEYGKVYSLYHLAETGTWRESEALPAIVPLKPVVIPDYKAMQATADAKRVAKSEASAKLRTEHPELIVGTDLTIAAKNIRIELKNAFPGVKFNVTTSRFSMGDDISVKWTDGPTSKEIDSIIDKYSDGDFDGMTDCYNYRGSIWTETFGGGKYVNSNRCYSDAFLTRVIVQLASKYGIKNVPEVDEYKNGRAQGSPFENTGDHWNRSDEWQTIINREIGGIKG